MSGRLGVGDQEVGRGDCLGALSLLAEQGHTTRAVALRDCVLIAFAPDDFNTLLVRYPNLQLELVRGIARRFAGTSATKSRDGRRFAIVPIHPQVDVTAFGAQLAEALRPLGDTLVLDAQSIVSHGVMDKAAAEVPDHPAWLRFRTWLDDQDDQHGFVVMVADGEDGAWSRQCLRQCDQVLLLAPADASPERLAGEQGLFDGKAAKGAEKTLVLLHENGALPHNTKRWLQARKVHHHRHVRLGRDADFARLGRILAGRAVGLALGGGGARGLAHIGVIQAFEEAGVPIDVIGGTSMGSIIAAQYAMGLSTDEMIALNRQIAAAKPFREYTVPMLAMLRTRRIEESAKLSFGDRAMEDLWLNCFAVSSNLSTAQMEVHDTGPVWLATRASGALPGVLIPPVVRGDLHVDGGVINNLPADVMKDRCPGATVLVNVSPDQQDAFTVPQLPGPWALFWRWLLPFGAPLNSPTILHILGRSATLSSANHAATVQGQADLCLRPPIDEYGLLDFDRLDDIVQVGREYGRERIASWWKSQVTH